VFFRIGRALRILLSLLLTALVGVLPLQSRAQDTPSAGFFTLAGGNIDGNYFAVARGICRAVNRRHVGLLRCSPESTAGATYNLEALHRGRVDFAIVQSDLLASARNGDGLFSTDGPVADLNGIAALYEETVIVLVGRDSGIDDLADLVGTRVDVGPQSSGRRVTLDRILAALDLDIFSFSEVSELPAASAVDELCQDRLDAVVLIVGNPDVNVGRALGECGAAILPLGRGPSAAKIDAMETYDRVILPAGVYPEVATPLPTFGVKAMLVTRAGTRADMVMAIADVLSRETATLYRAAPVLKQDASHAWPETAPVPVHTALSPG
jgi:TRAP transporter TAXI family solute receptor